MSESDFENKAGLPGFGMSPSILDALRATQRQSAEELARLRQELERAQAACQEMATKLSRILPHRHVTSCLTEEVYTDDCPACKYEKDNPGALLLAKLAALEKVRDAAMCAIQSPRGLPSAFSLNELANALAAAKETHNG